MSLKMIYQPPELLSRGLILVPDYPNAIELQGNWNAATNTPDITGTTNTGNAWVVSVGGTTELGLIDSWAVNDIAIKVAGEDEWIKIDNQSISNYISYH